MANRPPSVVALSMRLNEIRWPWLSHTATFTIMLSCRAFAMAAATIVFASAKVSVMDQISRGVSGPVSIERITPACRECAPANSELEMLDGLQQAETLR